MATTATDIGDFLAVPKEEQEEVDPAPEYNSDAGFDVQVVPDGEFKELSTASDDEKAIKGSEDEGDGSPEEFLSPFDPEHNREGDQ